MTAAVALTVGEAAAIGCWIGLFCDRQRPRPPQNPPRPEGWPE